MIDKEIWNEKAKEIAWDERYSKNGSFDQDAEAEVLQELLTGDETFGAVITAHQNAVFVDNHELSDELSDDTLRHLVLAAHDLSHVREMIVTRHKETTQEVVELRDRLELPWSGAFELYQAGYETVQGIRDATQSEMSEEGVGKALAARAKAEVSREAEA